jgi:uncharacterized protein YjeT (DUF2065 family)
MPDKAGSEPSPLERLVAAKETEKKAQRKKDSRVLVSIALAVVVLVGGGVFAFVHFAPQSWRHQVAALVRSSASARPSGQAAPAVKLTTQPLSRRRRRDHHPGGQHARPVHRGAGPLGLRNDP